MNFLLISHVLVMKSEFMAFCLQMWMQTKQTLQLLMRIHRTFFFNYHRGKLVYGLILFEFTDAIIDGDGDRLFDIYKLALLLYKVGGHYKYAYITLFSLVIYNPVLKVNAILPQSIAHEMKWNRFFDKHGGKGKKHSIRPENGATEQNIKITVEKSGSKSDRKECSKNGFIIRIT